MAHRRWLPHARALSLYTVVAIALAWPLPLHLSTHLTGPVDGDTGVYVWNQWVFHHELVENRTLPYFTGKIFALTPRANLSLHNYTTFANVLALPLIPLLGVVATFNVVYLALTVFTAYAMYLLALHLTGRAEAESWLAGALLAWSPVLVSRGAAHFSLVAVAPLPIFILLLLKAPAAWQPRHGIALGAAMAWASTSDVYYGVFCVLIAATVLGAHLLNLRRAERTIQTAAWVRATDVLLVVMVGLVAAILIGRGWRLTFLGRSVSFRSLYTPMLVVTALLLVRGLLLYRPAVVRVEGSTVWRALRVAGVTMVACVALLAPVLYAFGRRLMDGREGDVSRVLWRSSPPGADALALILPNPNHPLAPASLTAWLTERPGGYVENVASIPLVALATLAVARWSGWRLPRLWAVLAGAFALLALGPFIHVGGLNTHVPGPWALLRYVPIVGLTRAPGRYAIVSMLAVAALFALALAWLVRRYPGRRRAILAGVGVILAIELLPVPRQLYGAGIPAFYTRIAQDPRPDVRVLELPVGARDGTRSVGNFTARSQFYQTFHEKPLIGGYLSRVSRKRVAEMRRYAVIDALLTLSEGRPLPEALRRRAERQAAVFLQRSQLGYVVIDRSRASPELIDFAVRVLRLEMIACEDALDLYAPG